MKCPYCEKEMVVGVISQDRYALKWIPADKDKGLLNFTPLVKGIKLTSMTDGVTVKVFYCEQCRKFLIDQDDLRMHD
ncbi:PF20097 family protein [Diplocloster hominis]|uniref:PF20097 family protein n=1 Tax=Diplocloster hominis TaxID=3079010 RepID=UPI0031BB6773